MDPSEIYYINFPVQISLGCCTSWFGTDSAGPFRQMLSDVCQKVCLAAMENKRLAIYHGLLSQIFQFLSHSGASDCVGHPGNSESALWVPL